MITMPTYEFVTKTAHATLEIDTYNRVLGLARHQICCLVRAMNKRILRHLLDEATLLSLCEFDVQTGADVR